jgi:hypothetical protein
MKNPRERVSVSQFHEKPLETCIYNIVFKHPVALMYLDTQYNSIKNATTPITSSSHDMFWPQMANFRCLSYAKTVPLSTYSCHM